MKQIVTAAEIKRSDEAAINTGISSRALTERAAAGVLRVLVENFPSGRTLFLCGPGNNGADGFAMARLFTLSGGDAAVCYPGFFGKDGKPDPARMSSACAEQYRLLPSSVPILPEFEPTGFQTAVDALFGVGLSRPTDGRYAETISALNRSGLPVLSVDLPSGLFADTGIPAGTAVHATATAVITAEKPAHLLYPGSTLCGKLFSVEIGVPVGDTLMSQLEKSDLSRLPERPVNAHKGTFGRVLIVGGSTGMSGAAYLAALAAYRSGAGLVEIFCPADNRIIYQTQLPEAILTCYAAETAEEKLRTSLDKADAVALGMGLSESDITTALLRTALRFCRVPLILDADALNTLSKNPDLIRELCLKQEPVILTPHLGEMSRLTHKPIDEISKNLPESALETAAFTDTVTVLKGARTVISDGHRIFLNIFGNSGMATAGSGDVLSGIIASFAAQGTPIPDAAALGVLAHALAGDEALAHCGNRGLMARDLIAALSEVLR